MSRSEEEVDEWKCETSAPSLQLSGEVGLRQACLGLPIYHQNGF